MNTISKIPFYLKTSQIILGLIGLFFILYIGQEIIIPLIFSFIIAILLNPVVNYLISKKINQTAAILITILLAISCLAALLYFISYQMAMFTEMVPQLKEKINTLANNSINWISQTFNVSDMKIKEWIAQMKKEAATAGKALIGPTIISLGGMIAVILLLPVYIFLILFYKKLFLEFISHLFKGENGRTVTEILVESKLLIQNYLVGLIIETGIVATLNTVGLLIIGIEYALLLGVVSALLNIIPYVGGIIAMALIIIVALATESPIYALWVLIIFSFIQFLDNNIIVPKIVGSKVRINEFIAVVAVLIGGALWGIPGMFLSLPITAILKVIFDRVEPLKPLGLLFGKGETLNKNKILKLSGRKLKKSNS
jgi:predicted PurR-regulated permease PerM